MANQLQSDLFYAGGTASIAVPIVTEWEDFTPTGSWTTNTTYTGKYRRVGSSMDIIMTATLAGAPNSTDFTFDMPTGFTIDSSKLTGAVNDRSPKLGTATVHDANTTGTYGVIGSYSGSGSNIRISSFQDSGVQELTWTNVTQISPITFASGDTVTFRAEALPIAEWQSQALIGTTKEATATESGLVKLNKWAKKTYVSANSDLTFNLEDGKTYDIYVYARSGLPATSVLVTIEMYDGVTQTAPNKISTVLHQNLSTPANFVATSTSNSRHTMVNGGTLTASVVIGSASLLYEGYVIVKEINQAELSATTDWN